MPGWLSTLGVCSLPHLLGAGGLLAELPGSGGGDELLTFLALTSFSLASSWGGKRGRGRVGRGGGEWVTAGFLVSI